MKNIARNVMKLDGKLLYISVIVALLISIVNLSICFAQNSVGLLTSPEIRRSENYFNEGGQVNSVGISFGVAATTQILEKFSLFYGLTYSSHRFISEGNISQIGVSEYGTLYNLRTFEQSQQSLEVPIHLRYNTTNINSRLFLYLFAGISNSYILEIENRYATENMTIETSPNVSGRYNLAPEIGFGLSYNLSESIALNLQPNVRIEINQPIIVSNIGLNLSVLYNLNK